MTVTDVHLIIFVVWLCASIAYVHIYIYIYMYM